MNKKKELTINAVVLLVFLSCSLSIRAEATVSKPAGMFSYGCWIEAESIHGTRDTNFQNITKKAGSSKEGEEIFSEGKALSCGAPHNSLPSPGKFFAMYEFEVPARDRYILWVRSSSLIEISAF